MYGKSKQLWLLQLQSTECRACYFFILNPVINHCLFKRSVRQDHIISTSNRDYALPQIQSQLKKLPSGARVSRISR